MRERGGERCALIRIQTVMCWFWTLENPLLVLLTHVIVPRGCDEVVRVGTERHFAYRVVGRVLYFNVLHGIVRSRPSAERSLLKHNSSSLNGLRNRNKVLLSVLDLRSQKLVAVGTGSYIIRIARALAAPTG